MSTFSKFYNKLSHEPSITPNIRIVFIAFTLSFIFMCIAARDNFSDPFLHAQDMANYLGIESYALNIGIIEGRWINYLWVVGFRSANLEFIFFLCLILHSLTGALFSFALFRNYATISNVTLFSVAFSLSPQIADLSQWLYIFPPLLIFMIIYSYICAFKSDRTMIMGLIILGPISIMSYTAMPLILIMMFILTIGKAFSLREYIVIFITFGAIQVAVIFVIFSINLSVFGVFGIIPASTRVIEDPIPEFSTAYEWMVYFAMWVLNKFSTAILMNKWALLAIALASTVIIFYRSKDLFVRVSISFICVVGFCATILIATGVGIPDRAMIFMWMLALAASACLLRVSRPLGAPGSVLGYAPGVLGIAVACHMIITGGMFWKNQFHGLAAYQHESRAISDSIAAAVGGDPSVSVYIFGHPEALIHGEQLALTPKFGAEAFWLRDAQLRGSYAQAPCVSEDEFFPDPCQRWSATARALPVYPADGYVSRADENTVLVNLPTLDVQN